MKLSKKHDPTRTATKVNAAEAQMRRRMREAAKRCADYVRDMPRQMVANALIKVRRKRLFANAEYSFELDAGIMERIERDIEQIMRSSLIDENWLANEYVAPAYASGTAQAASTLGAQYVAFQADINIIAATPAYQLRLQLVKARVFEEMTGFTADVASEVSGILGRAILDGLNPLDVAQDIADSIGSKLYRGERIARTEITTALRRGRLDEGDAAAEQTGLRIMYMHISAFAPTSRPTHMMRHGELFTSQECRVWWAKDANSINCYLPDTKVSGRFVAGSKAKYRGEVVKVVTASGRYVTVTPNHPIMTDRGLVAAAKLNKGDYAIAHHVNVENPAGVGDLDGKQVYTTIEEAFSSLMDLGHSHLAGVCAVDFHGDGVGMDENIRVVDSDRVLTTNITPTGEKILDNLSLVHADPAFHKANSSALLDGHTVSAALSSFASRFSDRVLFILRHLGVGNPDRLGVIPLGETVTIKEPNDSTPTETSSSTHVKYGLASKVEIVKLTSAVDTSYLSTGSSGCSGVYNGLPHPIEAEPSIIRNVLHTESEFIARDNIVDVIFSYYDGHVYDLQEVSGLMVANGLIASNCLCSIIEVFADSEGKPLAPGLLSKAAEIKAKYEGKS